MKTAYFTFGQAHTHSCGGHTLDKDCIVKITAEDPRAKMFELFGDKWAMQYDSLEKLHLEYYPRGVFDVNNNRFIDLDDDIYCNHQMTALGLCVACGKEVG